MAVSARADEVIRGQTDRYSGQLAQGFRRLRFEPGLEADYRRQLIEESQRPALIVAIAAILLWSGFAILDIVRLELDKSWSLTEREWLILTMRWLTMGALIAYLTPWIRSNDHADVLAFCAYTLLGASGAISTIIYQSMHLPSGYANLIVITMAAFLPLGMRFYQALTASLLVVLAAALTGLIVRPPEQMSDHAYLICVMLIGVLVASVGGYLHERAHRRQFLLSAILSRQAQVDPLTELANRRLFRRHASAAITHAGRTGDALVLAVIDIDHFKNFNDSFGHTAGDEALRAVASIIGDAARRPMDMAARLGGEEFALLLYSTGPEEAGAILETLRERVSAAVIAVNGSLTISIGATALGEDDDLDRLYARADSLLYASKHDGRDRLTLG